MLERQRKLNFSAEMQLQATTGCDIYKLHPRLPNFCLFSKYFPSEFAFHILLLIQYISHSLGAQKVYLLLNK